MPFQCRASSRETCKRGCRRPQGGHGGTARGSVVWRPGSAACKNLGILVPCSIVATARKKCRTHRHRDADGASQSAQVLGRRIDCPRPPPVIPSVWWARAAKAPSRVFLERRRARRRRALPLKQGYAGDQASCITSLTQGLGRVVQCVAATEAM